MRKPTLVNYAIAFRIANWYIVMGGCLSVGLLLVFHIIPAEAFDIHQHIMFMREGKGRVVSERPTANSTLPPY